MWRTGGDAETLLEAWGKDWDEMEMETAGSLLAGVKPCANLAHLRPQNYVF